MEHPLPAVAAWSTRRTRTVATLMGHSSTRMVEKVYGKLSAKNMDDAIAVLPVFGALPQPKVDDEDR